MPKYMYIYMSNYTRVYIQLIELEFYSYKYKNICIIHIRISFVRHRIICVLILACTYSYMCKLYICFIIVLYTVIRVFLPEYTSNYTSRIYNYKTVFNRFVQIYE